MCIYIYSYLFTISLNGLTLDSALSHWALNFRVDAGAGLPNRSDPSRRRCVRPWILQLSCVMFSNRYSWRCWCWLQPTHSARPTQLGYSKSGELELEKMGTESVCRACRFVDFRFLAVLHQTNTVFWQFGQALHRSRKAAKFWVWWFSALRLFVCRSTVLPCKHSRFEVEFWGRSALGSGMDALTEFWRLNSFHRKTW